MSSNMVDEVEIKRTLRDLQPSHYMFTIESFSVFLDAETENFESDAFEAGGYKWKLCFYPNGNKKRGKDHISLYLAISDTNNLPCGWEVNVNFKFFIFDHIRGKYLTIEDVEQVRRFHVMKIEWGFEKVLSLKEFLNPSNGYLFDDTCVFGVEVFVMKFAGKGQCLSIKELSDSTYTWKVDNFSALCKKCLHSDIFNTGGWNWKISLYPKGDGKVKCKSLSLFLEVADYEKFSHKPKLYAKYKLRIIDQVNGKHCETKTSDWFSAMNTSWGYPSFMSLSDLNDKSKGFIMNDTIIIEAEIEMLSETKNFT